MPGMKAMASPPSTSTIGYGTRTNWEATSRRRPAARSAARIALSPAVKPSSIGASLASVSGTAAVRTGCLAQAGSVLARQLAAAQAPPPVAVRAAGGVQARLAAEAEHVLGGDDREPRA